MLEQTQTAWSPPAVGKLPAQDRTVEIASQGRPIKMMMVDDDLDDCNAVMGEFLAGGLGNLVHYVHGGKEAIRTLRSGAPLPDLILLEMYLHDLRGRDVLRLIKRNPRYDGIDVIAVSHFASATFVRKVYEEGVSCFMRKPFTLQGFLLALGTLQPGKYGITVTRASCGE